MKRPNPNQILLISVVVITFLLFLLCGSILWFLQYFATSILGESRKESSIVSPNRRLKAVLYNLGDGWEPNHWRYELIDLKTGDMQVISNCEGAGLANYRLIKWSDDAHFTVRAELYHYEQERKQIIDTVVDIKSPKTPCQFPGVDVDNWPQIKKFHVVLPDS